MMEKIKRVTVCMVALFLLGCSKNGPSDEVHSFEKEPVIRPVIPKIAEASGIADSKVNPGYLWVHEDRGHDAQLYLLGHNGEIAKTIFLEGATNRDWEDMELAGNDVYVGDIGDNEKAYEAYTIYKFPEPEAAADTALVSESINFRYPDGAHNAEALLVDPLSKDIYIITKSEPPSGIYKIAHPYHTTSINTAALVGSLAYGAVVSAAMSADGKGIIIKTYTSLLYYSRKGDESVEQALQRKYMTLPYIPEPQGEAVTFSVNNNGYFTLSEMDLTDELYLYHYKKK